MRIRILVLLALAACGSDSDDAADDDTTDPDASVDPNCAQAADFIDVSTGSAGPDYPDPELSVTCTETEVVVESNNIPNFTFENVTPNGLEAHDMVWHLPRDPAMAAQTTAVPLGGDVAVAVNGLMIFGPTEAAQMGYRDPYLDGLLDSCNGHTAPGGMYHFHAKPGCLMTQLGAGRVIAYAFDGYPVIAVEGTLPASSWQRVPEQWYGDQPLYDGTTRGSWDIYEYVEGSGDLDECNGKMLDDGSYAYFLTETFPYFVGCYRGTPNL